MTKSCTFKLERVIENGKATVGMLYVGDYFFCFTLEDGLKEKKVAGETRIPAGTYRLEKTYNSGLLSRMKNSGWYPFDWIPTICEVPGFTNIRIHSGNTEKHTDGCPLVGFTADVRNMTIGKSRECMLEFVEKLETCFNDGEVYLTITDERQ